MSIWCAQIFLPRSLLHSGTSILAAPTNPPTAYTAMPKTGALNRFNTTTMWTVDMGNGEYGYVKAPDVAALACCWLNAEHICLISLVFCCDGNGWHALAIDWLFTNYIDHWSSPTDHANHPSARFPSFSLLLLHFYTFSYNVHFSHLPNWFRLSTIGELHLINTIKAVGRFYSFGGVYIRIAVYEGFLQEIGLHYICGELCFFANTQYVDVNMITWFG